ncbi:MAG: HdeA/HdeB family chaperone [Chromatiaceae bacterium]
MYIKQPESRKSPVPALLPGVCSVLALTACLMVGSAQAADQGPRAHAQGKYDTVTATYVVVEGDDLFAISERLQVPVDDLKNHNKLASDKVEAGQKLAVGTAGGSADKSAAHPSAAHPSAAHQTAAKKPLAKMTCEDFVSLDETFQPKAVYWAVAYSKSGQPEAEEVDVVGVERAVPIVVQECQKTPKESFWQKAKAEFKKLEQKF